MKSFLKPLIPALLLLAVLTFPVFSVCLRMFVDFLSMGFSGGKTLMLLAFLTLIFACQKIPSPWRSEWNPALLVGIVVLHATALFERFLFLRPLGVPWGSWQAAVTDGRYSTTRLAHIHEAKAVVGWMTGYVGSGLDSGFVFIPYFPTWLLAAHALLLLTVTAIACLVVHRFQAEESTEKTVTLALAVFAMVKVTVDGGPFCPESIVPAFFLLGLLFGRPGAQWGLGLTVVWLPICLWVTGTSKITFDLLKILGAVMLLLLPLLLEKVRAMKSRAGYAALGAFTLVLLSLPWMQYQSSPFIHNPPFALGTIIYGRAVLPQGTNITIFSDKSLQVPSGAPIMVKGEWKGQWLVATRAVVMRPTTAAELCKMFGLNLSWQPVVWYPRVAYCEFTGKLPRPLPANWPSSELVSEYAVEEKGDRTRIVLGLRGGGRMTPAYDALPPGSFVLTDYNITEKRPQAAEWKRGPGWAPPVDGDGSPAREPKGISTSRSPNASASPRASVDGTAPITGEASPPKANR